MFDRHFGQRACAICVISHAQLPTHLRLSLCTPKHTWNEKQDYTKARYVRGYTWADIQLERYFWCFNRKCPIIWENIIEEPLHDKQLSLTLWCYKCRDYIFHSPFHSPAQFSPSRLLKGKKEFLRYHELNPILPANKSCPTTICNSCLAQDIFWHCCTSRW